MKAKILTAALALLVVTAGAAAAMPGNAPDDPGADASNDDQYGPEDNPGEDARDNNESDTDGEMDENESEEERSGPPADAGPSDDAGPPVELPEQVPDHVGSIHDDVETGGVSLDSIPVAGDLMIWRHEDALLVAGAAYPAISLASAIDRQGGDASEVDTGFDPEAYRQEIRVILTGVE